MKKFFAAALVVSMLTVLLSGCMCQVADTTFQFDGSGTVEAKFGFSEEMVNAMNMRAEMTQNGFSFFRYDGHGYYGDQASESFANADEFNAIFAEVSAETAEVSKAATPGTVTLSVASDGGLTLTVQNTQTDRRSAIKTELAKRLPDYSDAQINALLEDMVMTYRFAFPAALVDYNAAAGITVEENVVTVDYLTLNAGTYRFTTSETESLHQRPLGTVTQESIPASGTAYMRRQTIELDGRDVTLQTYALPGSSGGETNYVRLRDIASVLNGTNAQFSVDWDGSVVITPGEPYAVDWDGNVIIVPDEAYKPNGTEMQAPFSGDRHYQKADAKTVIYGESIPFTAILLTDDQGGGYTYYKLRDLGKVLNFNVGWSNSRGIYIESNHAYEG